MMGRLNHDQGQFFYSFRLDGAVPDDHLVRQIAAIQHVVSISSSSVQDRCCVDRLRPPH